MERYLYSLTCFHSMMLGWQLDLDWNHVAMCLQVQKFSVLTLEQNCGWIWASFLHYWHPVMLCNEYPVEKLCSFSQCSSLVWYSRINIVSQRSKKSPVTTDTLYWRCVLSGNYTGPKLGPSSGYNNTRNWICVET